MNPIYDIDIYRIPFSISEHAKEVSSMTRLVIGNLFAALNTIPEQIGNEICELDIYQAVVIHQNVETLFERALQSYIAFGAIKYQDAMTLRFHQVKRVKSVMNLYSDDWAKCNFIKIEKRIWKIFMQTFAAERGIQMIPYKQASTRKQMRQRIKARSCGFYAFYKVKDVFMTCFLGSGRNRLDGLAKHIGMTVSDFIQFAGKMDRSANSLLSLLVGKLNYQIVKEQQKGDVAIFFDEQGAWQHIGYCYNEELIESKWGKLPVFRHRPEDTPYGTFYLLLRPNKMQT